MSAAVMACYRSRSVVTISTRAGSMRTYPPSGTRAFVRARAVPEKGLRIMKVVAGRLAPESTRHYKRSAGLLTLPCRAESRSARKQEPRGSVRGPAIDASAAAIAGGVAGAVPSLFPTQRRLGPRLCVSLMFGIGVTSYRLLARRICGRSSGDSRKAGGQHRRTLGFCCKRRRLGHRCGMLSSCVSAGYGDFARGR